MRDRPLNFSAMADSKILEVLKPKTTAREQAALHITGCLLEAARDSSWVSYSRNRNWYSGKQRYHGAHFGYRAALAAVRLLSEASLIDNQITPPGTHSAVQSRMRAKSLLLDMMADTTIVPVRSREVLELRDHDRNLIDYRETRQTRLLRRQVEEMNESLSGIRWSIDHPDAQHMDRHSILIGENVIRVWGDDLYAVRIFNRGSWRHGGRFYAWYQQLPSAVRRAMLIGGELVVLLDYTAMHTTMLYNQAGIALDGDPYEIAGYPREEVKLGLNIAYNAKTPHGARSALALKLAERDGRYVVTTSDHARAARILAALREKHPGIASAFGSDNGAGLQYRDSEIIREVTAKCAREGISALPVHDELIVPAKYEGRVSELMVQTFAEKEPGPNIAKIKDPRVEGASGGTRREGSHHRRFKM
jgi:hypothetical protein